MSLSSKQSRFAGSDVDLLLHRLFGRALARRTISTELVPARTTWCLLGYMLDTVMDLVELKISLQDNQRNARMQTRFIP